MAFTGSFDNTGSRVLFKVHAGSTAGSKWGPGAVRIICMVLLHRVVLDIRVTVAANVTHPIHAVLRHVVFLFTPCENQLII